MSPSRERRVPRALALHDDPDLLNALEQGLWRAGYDVRARIELEGLEELVERFQPDVTICPLGAAELPNPRLGGLRAHLPGLGAVLALARREDGYRLAAGLEGRAFDDYLVLPLRVEELLTRLRVLLERRRRAAQQVLRRGPLRLDLARREASCGDVPLDLTATEFRLLATFLRHPNEVITREALCAAAWDEGDHDVTNLVTVYISRLRSKLRAAGQDGLIQTLRGGGYLLRDERAAG